MAAEAGVATSLLYYYFDNRNGLVRATLDHADDRAARSTATSSLLGEFDVEARDTSVVWGEVLASAVFEPELRDQVKEATDAWNALVAARTSTNPMPSPSA